MDRRLTPATDRVALDSLRGTLDRPAYVPGEAARLAVPVADLRDAPQGRRDRQVIWGADLTVIERRGDMAFVQAGLDGYCGWLPACALLTGDLPAITHRVTAPATHLYSESDIKSPEQALLTLGSRLSVTGTSGSLARLAGGGWVPHGHLTCRPAPDPVAVARSLLGTPYLWGGNSRSGIDCSGLVQAALTACDIPCPGDSDLQRAAFPQVHDIRRGDLLFWPGHVAMAIGPYRMIHATAHGMRVMIEPIRTALTRIEAADQGPWLGIRRPPILRC